MVIPCSHPLLTYDPLQSSQQDLARLMDKHRGLASDFDRMEQAQLKRRQTLEASEYEKEHAKAKARCVREPLAPFHPLN